jgi:hypothetical protein
MQPRARSDARGSEEACGKTWRSCSTAQRGKRWALDRAPSSTRRYAALRSASNKRRTSIPERPHARIASAQQQVGRLAELRRTWPSGWRPSRCTCSSPPPSPCLRRSCSEIGAQDVRRRRSLGRAARRAAQKAGRRSVAKCALRCSEPAPLLPVQASHLALPFRSRKPGRAAEHEHAHREARCEHARRDADATPCPTAQQPPRARRGTRDPRALVVLSPRFACLKSA